MSQPESKLSLKIQGELKKRGAYVWKVHGNEYTPAGTPDIVGVFRGHFIGVETKMPGNVCSPIQEYRIGKMRESGALIVAPCYTVLQALELLEGITALYERDVTVWHRGESLKANLDRAARVMMELQQKYGRGAVFNNDRDGAA